MNQEQLERARRVRLMAFDVDGIMTDGRLYLTASGEEMKSFHTLDGQGIKLLMDSGIRVALITARHSTIVATRARELGVGQVRQGVQDKLGALGEILTEYSLDYGDCGYAGDDLADLACLMKCTFACTVPAAPLSVRRHAHYVTSVPGGEGAVREICDQILEAQGKLESAIAAFMPQV